MRGTPLSILKVIHLTFNLPFTITTISSTMKADNKPSSSPGLSLWEKIDLFPALLSILTSALYASVTGLFRGKNGTRTYRLHIFRQLIHKGILRLSFRQTQ